MKFRLTRSTRSKVKRFWSLTLSKTHLNLSVPRHQRRTWQKNLRSWERTGSTSDNRSQMGSSTSASTAKPSTWMISSSKMLRAKWSIIFLCFVSVMTTRRRREVTLYTDWCPRLWNSRTYFWASSRKSSLNNLGVCKARFSSGWIKRTSFNQFCSSPWSLKRTHSLKKTHSLISPWKSLKEISSSFTQLTLSLKMRRSSCTITSRLCSTSSKTTSPVFVLSMTAKLSRIGSISKTSGTKTTSKPQTFWASSRRRYLLKWSTRFLWLKLTSRITRPATSFKMFWKRQCLCSFRSRQIQSTAKSNSRISLKSSPLTPLTSTWRRRR